MPDLIPMTRQEKFLNGDTDLEPITRREHFYAGREGELPEGSQDPQTREEYFIKKYRGGGGGDITVESLSVTSNGTYTAPSGKAYSPVEVNVPLPQNAYLLKSVNTPTPIASFTDSEEMVMPTLKVAIEPQQDLHGHDAPWAGGAGKNKYPILIGADEFNDNASATHTNNDGVLVINATATNDSGAYSKSTSTIMGLVGQYSESITYSFDIKANISGSVLVGYSDVGRKTVDLTTNWQRVTITDTAVGTNKAFVIYNRSGSAMEIQVKNFMFEIGSVAHPYEPYSNICPISGWTGANIYRYGKNFVNPSTLEFTNNGYVFGNNIPLKGGYTYILSLKQSLGDGRIYQYDSNGNQVGSTISFSGKQKTFTAENNCVKVNFRSAILSGATPTIEDCEPQIELGNTATTYAPYAGNLITIAFGQEVYGGWLDVVNGKLYAYPYYASYNGETLVGEWISSLDAYAEGTTPTTGAQVLNIGAEPTVIDISTPCVKSLEGVNNLFADCGQVQELSYFSK